MRNNKRRSCRTLPFRLLAPLLFSFFLHCASEVDTGASPWNIASLVESISGVPASGDFHVDLFQFKLTEVRTENSNTVVLIFNQPVDPVSGSNSTNFSITESDNSSVELPIIVAGTSGNLIRLFTVEEQVVEKKYTVWINHEAVYEQEQIHTLSESESKTFSGWGFRLDEVNTAFADAKTLNLEFTALVNCADLTQKANYTLSGKKPVSVSVENGCSGSAAAATLSFSESFRLGNHRLVINPSMTSAASQELSRSEYTVARILPVFRLTGARALTANSLALSFSKNLQAAGLRNSDFSVNGVSPEHFSVSSNVVVIDSLAYSLEPNTVYMVNYNNISDSEGSASCSGGIGVPGSGTTLVERLEVPGFGAIRVYTSVALDKNHVEQTSIYGGDCGITQATLDSDGTLCGSTDRCVELLYTAAGSSCLLNLSELKSDVGRLLFAGVTEIELNLKGKVSKSAGAFVHMAGRSLEYSTEDMQSFRIRTGYLAESGNSIAFSGFSRKGIAVSAKPLVFALP